MKKTDQTTQDSNRRAGAGGYAAAVKGGQPMSGLFLDYIKNKQKKGKKQTRGSNKLKGSASPSIFLYQISKNASILYS